VDFFAGAACFRGAFRAGLFAAARATVGLLMPRGAWAIAISSGGGVTQPVTAMATTNNGIKEKATRMRAIRHVYRNLCEAGLTAGMVNNL
jgi:hypothetical protein